MVDYIIVGAGSAGCVLANRLTENPDTTVLLLEAGGPDNNPELRIPTRWFDLLCTDVDWCYQTEPQVHLNNRVVEWNRGKVLGGSSSTNALVYIRGDHQDYNRWARLGNAGWGFDDVLPYFKKAEHQERGASEYHGIGGPFNVADVSYRFPVCEIFLEACQQMGLQVNDDFNGKTQEGVGWYQVTQKAGERHSAADAFLRPALNRNNLDARTHAHVTRILFKGTRAIGVEYVHQNETKQAYASHEVILCGGAINSPQTLLGSGVGPADHLRSLGIPIVLDLPGVGQNLQDHPKVDYQYTSTAPNVYDFSLQGDAYEEYVDHKTGPLSVVRSPVGGFLKTHPDLYLPDVQYYVAQAAATDPQDFNIVSCLSRPKSRGSIALRSSDPFAYPIIQPNYLEHEDDLVVFVKSAHFVRELTHTHPFTSHIEARINPRASVRTDDEIRSWLREHIGTSWHCCGTCKMGVDAEAVVNPQLQIIGLENIRVVDASVMPDLTGGNINAVVIMIAEKAADMILSSA